LNLGGLSNTNICPRKRKQAHQLQQYQIQHFLRYLLIIQCYQSSINGKIHRQEYHWYGFLFSESDTSNAALNFNRTYSFSTLVSSNSSIIIAPTTSGASLNTYGTPLISTSITSRPLTVINDNVPRLSTTDNQSSSYVSTLANSTLSTRSSSSESLTVDKEVIQPVPPSNKRTSRKQTSPTPRKRRKRF